MLPLKKGLPTKNRPMVSIRPSRRTCTRMPQRHRPKAPQNAGPYQNPFGFHFVIFGSKRHAKGEKARGFLYQPKDFQENLARKINPQVGSNPTRPLRSYLGVALLNSGGKVHESVKSCQIRLFSNPELADPIRQRYLRPKSLLHSLRIRST